MLALEKQKNEDIYSKTNNELIQEYEKYEKVYNLPPYAISNHNWDIIFSTLYEYLKDLSLESEYPYYAKVYLRYSLADALLRSTTKINIDNFINALQYLEMLNFPKKDIHNIQKALKVKIQENKSNIININEIKNFKRNHKILSTINFLFHLTLS